MGKSNKLWWRIGFDRKVKRRLLLSFLSFVLFLNLAAYIGVYNLTHYRAANSWGLGTIRPENSRSPRELGLDYTTVKIPIERDEWLETWSISAPNSPAGTVILFPGNGGNKSKQLLLPAQAFHALGYQTLLVDFRGVGGSSGNTTTIGMREAEDVVASVNYAAKMHLPRPTILYGVSMGTAAILKAVAADKVAPDGIILELPFYRLIDAIASRLQAQSIPTFPLAELMVFWGGIQHGFNGFAHNPIDYAKHVKCPTAILHGKLDRWTTIDRIEQIFNNLSIGKQLSIFPTAGHDLLITRDRRYWTQEIHKFLNKITNK